MKYFFVLVLICDSLTTYSQITSSPTVSSSVELNWETPQNWNKNLPFDQYTQLNVTHLKQEYKIIQLHITDLSNSDANTIESKDQKELESFLNKSMYVMQKSNSGTAVAFILPPLKPNKNFLFYFTVFEEKTLSPDEKAELMDKLKNDQIFLNSINSSLNDISYQALESASLFTIVENHIKLINANYTIERKNFISEADANLLLYENIIKISLENTARKIIQLIDIADTTDIETDNLKLLIVDDQEEPKLSATALSNLDKTYKSVFDFIEELFRDSRFNSETGNITAIRAEIESLITEIIHEQEIFINEMIKHIIAEKVYTLEILNQSYSAKKVR